jgi:hypothetical protein
MVRNRKNDIKELKFLAKIIAVHCVRNTIIEDYHSEGKLGQLEMKNFNKEVCNKIYTYLYLCCFKTKDWQKLFLGEYGVGSIVGWDNPTLDKNFMKAVKNLKGE